MDDKDSVAITEAYFRGRQDGLTILEANIAEAKREERERVIRLLKAKRLKANALLLARQEIYRQIDPTGETRQALKIGKLGG